MTDNDTGRVERSSSSLSARVTPLYDEQINYQKEQVIDIPMQFGKILGFSDTGVINKLSDGPEVEHNPADAWLPITESRNGNLFATTCHLLCSGIGMQALLLPFAFIALGWVWGLICLSAAFLWQLYTTWLLVNLHESSSISLQTGSPIRYSRFIHLSIVAFGPKLGKFLAVFPVLYLSSGACIFFVNSGGTTMELLYQVMCDNDHECQDNTLSGAIWFLMFICLAILISLCFTSLHSLTPVTFIGSITVVAYCTLIWILSLKNGAQASSQVKEVEKSGGERFSEVMIGLGLIAILFRGHNLLLEIQGTLPSDHKVPSRKSMWKGVIISYLVIALCLYPLAIACHWAYGNEVTMKGGILRPFLRSQQNNTSKYLVAVVLAMIIINYLCAFQVYIIVTFDNVERVFYVSKKNKPCSRCIRATIKILVGGVIYFAAVALPFMTYLAIFIGSLTITLTLSYPCFMWLAIKKPPRFSRMWFINVGLGSVGVLVSLVIFVAALWNLVVHHFHANFFDPR